jgi:ATP-dependent Zn protease
MHAYKGKEKKEIDSTQNNRTFSDVGGCKKAKEAIGEIIDYIKHPEAYTS